MSNEDRFYCLAHDHADRVEEVACSAAYQLDQAEAAIERLRNERDDYRERFEQTGCTRHSAMEATIRITEKQRVKIERLQDIINRALAVPANWGNEVYEIEDILKEAEVQK